MSSVLIVLLAAMAGAPQRVVVESVICGEIDPVVIGEACVIYVTGAGESAGLVARYEDLADAKLGTLQALTGKSIDLSPADLRRISAEDAAEVFGDDGRNYYWWNGRWAP